MNDLPRVLVVDDEEGLRITLAANLELEGFEVLEAADAEEALELVRNGERVDLVLSDIRMPGRSGVDMYLEFKRIAPELPVVLMTAFATEKSVTQAIEEGVFAVLGKPFDLERTLQTLHSALRRPVVLVVDDMPGVAETTAEALGSMGIRAKAVFSGEDAVAAMRDGAVDVCLTDLVMPGMNGLEVGDRARELDPNVIVIVFTGAAQGEQMMRQAAARGAYECIRKPLDAAGLATSIANARAGK
jgi:DNA-binding NtrC family response regulator